MAKHIGILISPTSEEFYDAYGPMTKLRDQATRFASKDVATSAANNRFGRHHNAFWESERASRDRAAVEFRGWTFRTEEVADDDPKRVGHTVAQYEMGQPERLYAHRDATGAITWDTEMQDCELWPDHGAALDFISTLDRPQGRGYAIASY